jgi:hypothetical protein
MIGDFDACWSARRRWWFKAQQALEQLAFGPCHHMEEVLAHPEEVPRWQAIVAGRKVNRDEVFTGYRSQVDWPGAHVCRESPMRCM